MYTVSFHFVALFNERDPGIIFLVDPFRLHQCMGLLSLRDSHGRPRISIDPGLAQGKQNTKVNCEVQCVCMP